MDNHICGCSLRRLVDAGHGAVILLESEHRNSKFRRSVYSFRSTQNPAVVNIYHLENYVYESNGYCSDKCKGQFAFAVVQDQSCWCSNYIPASQQSVSQCGEKCPGYPFENCGSLANGLFGYVALDKSPSGTAKGSTAQITVSIPASVHISTSVFGDFGYHDLLSSHQRD